MSKKDVILTFGKIFGRIPTTCSGCGRVFFCSRKTWVEPLIRYRHSFDPPIPCWKRKKCRCLECAGGGTKSSTCEYIGPDEVEELWNSTEG